MDEELFLIFKYTDLINLTVKEVKQQILPNHIQLLDTFGMKKFNLGRLHMANKRKNIDKKEKLIRNGKKLLDTVMGCSSWDKTKKTDGEEKIKDESPPSLNWLMNLSAASLFSSPQQNTVCYEELTKSESETKPGLTYTELIEKALKENGELTVSEIYKWIYTHYPYFKKDDSRWKNSIRHNLSINPQFRKGSKCHNGGHFWTLNKEYDEQFKKWQEHKKTVKIERKRKVLTRAEEDEVERATRSIMLLDDNNSVDDSTSLRKETSDPSLVRAATDILSGVTVEKQVEVEFMSKSDMISAPIIIEDILDCSDSILSDPLLFSDSLELGFQPYELIESRL